MRGSRPEDHALFVEVEGRRELFYKGHSEEHELGECVADKAVNFVGFRASGLDGFEAVSIHQGYAASDDHVSLGSSAVFLGESDPVGDIV